MNQFIEVRDIYKRMSWELVCGHKKTVAYNSQPNNWFPEIKDFHTILFRGEGTPAHKIISKTATR